MSHGQQYGEYKSKCTFLRHIVTSHILGQRVRITKIWRGPLVCIISWEVHFALVNRQWDRCKTVKSSANTHWKVHKWDRYTESIAQMLMELVPDDSFDLLFCRETPLYWHKQQGTLWGLCSILNPIASDPCFGEQTWLGYQVGIDLVSSFSSASWLMIWLGVWTFAGCFEQWKQRWRRLTGPVDWQFGLVPNSYWI